MTDQILNNSRDNQPVINNQSGTSGNVRKKVLSSDERIKREAQYEDDRLEALDGANAIPVWDRTPEQRFIILEELVAKLASKVHGVL